MEIKTLSTHPPVPPFSTDHYADDLEDELDEIMQSDFSVDLQDDSPREVRGRGRGKGEVIKGRKAVLILKKTLFLTGRPRPRRPPLRARVRRHHHPGRPAGGAPPAPADRVPAVDGGRRGGGRGGRGRRGGRVVLGQQRRRRRHGRRRGCARSGHSPAAGGGGGGRGRVHDGGAAAVKQERGACVFCYALLTCFWLLLSLHNVMVMTAAGIAAGVGRRPRAPSMSAGVSERMKAPLGRPQSR